jgi:predicted nucleotidyltransferase
MKGRPLDTEPAEFGEIARRLKDHYGAQRVWLFGSRAKGTADEDSDIDLLVVSPVSEGFFQRMASVRRLLRDCRAGGPISPIVLTPQELQARIEKGDQFIGDILANGVEL